MRPVNGDDDIDIQELLRAVDSAEILSILFPMLRKSLVIDTRFDLENEPLVRLMPQVSSTQERYRSVRRLRAQFPRPQHLTAIPWQRYVRSLGELGVIDRISQRLSQAGYPGPITALHEAVRELRRLEKREIAYAIQGNNYYTLWPPER